MIGVDQEVTELEARALQLLSERPRLVVDVAEGLGLPIRAVEGLLRGLEQRRLAARAEIGRPPTMHWGPA